MRMLGTLLILVLGATLFTTVINHYFFLSSMVGYIEEHGIAPTGYELLMASVQPLLIILPIVFVLLASILVFVSHRIAGPLHRLKMCMEKVKNGDYTVVLRFRKADAIHDVADSFNEMVQGIKQNFEQKNKA